MKNPLLGIAFLLLIPFYSYSQSDIYIETDTSLEHISRKVYYVNGMKHEDIGQWDENGDFTGVKRVYNKNNVLRTENVFNKNIAVGAPKVWLTEP